MNRRQILKAGFLAALVPVLAPVLKLIPASLRARVTIAEIDMSSRIPYLSGFTPTVWFPPDGMKRGIPLIDVKVQVEEDGKVRFDTGKATPRIEVVANQQEEMP